MYKLFYKPEDGWAADFIPFYDNGEFVLFYLHDWRDIAIYGEGVEWRQIRTSDFVKYKECGISIPRGNEHAQDLYVYTGSVIETGGRYYIFYTGRNPHFREHGLNEQAIMRAESDDLINWCKKPLDIILAPDELYERHDWRDPFVFYNEKENEYWMLVTAREKQGSWLRRGCIALFASNDLLSWKLNPPLWAPGLYYAHECPDMFEMNEKWWLIFSEYTDKCRTRYVESPFQTGPFRESKNPCFDGRAFYAAKTYSDGERRYLFGWIPTKISNEDSGLWMWGGNLAVHEVYELSDGSLGVKEPESIRKSFKGEISPHLKPQYGELFEENRQYTLLIQDHKPNSFALCSEPVGDCWRLSGRIIFDNNVTSFGLSIQYDQQKGSAYEYRFNICENCLTFDRWPHEPWQNLDFSGLEVPLFLEDNNEVTFTLLVDGDICVLYANSAIALSSRMYLDINGSWGVFTNGGAIKINDLKLMEL